MYVKAGRVLAGSLLLLVAFFIVFSAFLYVRDTDGFQVGKYFFEWRYENKKNFDWSYTRVMKRSEDLVGDNRIFKHVFVGTLKDKYQGANREIIFQLDEDLFLTTPISEGAVYYKWVFGLYLPGKSIFVWVRKSLDTFWEKDNLGDNLLFYSFSSGRDITKSSKIMAITEKFF